MTDEVLTVQEVAARLKIDERTVLYLIRAGRLKATRIRRIYRIPESALAEFLAEGQNEVLSKARQN